MGGCGESTWLEAEQAYADNSTPENLQAFNDAQNAMYDAKIAFEQAEAETRRLLDILYATEDFYRILINVYEAFYGPFPEVIE